QRDRVDSQRGLLAVAGRLIRLEARGPVAAQVRHDHPVALRGQERRDVGVGVDVVRPAVQEQNRRAVAGAVLDIADVQDAGIDLADGGGDAHRSDLKAARTSPMKMSGSCQAAKWLPASTSLK